MFDRKLKHIEVSVDLITRNPESVGLLFQKYIPVKAEYNVARETIRYTVYHASFEPVKKEEEIETISPTIEFIVEWI